MKIHTASFYKAIKLDKDMVESVSQKNSRYANVSLQEYKDVGLLVSTDTTSIVVPFANIAYYIGEQEAEKSKVTKIK